MYNKLSYFVLFTNLHQFQTGIITAFSCISNITDLSSSALSFVSDKADSQYRYIKYLFKDRLYL